jgi:hypothetical protein
VSGLPDATLARPGKLHLDCFGVVALGAPMPSDDDLINQLLARAGMVMEDAHGAALINEGDLSARIAAVKKAGAACVAFADAAERLRQMLPNVVSA